MAAQHGRYQLKNFPGGGGGSKYNEPSRMLKFSRLSFLNKLGLGLIQGDHIVQYHSDVARAWEQKKKPMKSAILGRYQLKCER